jgi:ATP-binding cassette subfamily C protein
MAMMGRPAPSANTEKGPIREALDVCGQHLRYAVLFSAIVNLAYLAPTLYMLQVYDRVVPSESELTLVFLTFALAATLFVLTYLDRMRARILMAASVSLDQAFAGRLFMRAIQSAADGRPLRLNQLMRDFDNIRAAVTGPAALAVFDAPWIPIYIVVCFVVHPLIGALALGGAVLLFTLAIFNERITRDLNKQAAMAGAASAGADVVRALGMTPAFLAQFEEGRARSAGPLMEGIRTSGRIGAFIRFLRLFLQSTALGLGAYLAIEKQISAGSIFASSMLAARALSPIDQIVANWRVLSSGMTSYEALRQELARPASTPSTLLPDPHAQLSVQRVSVLSPTRDRLLLSGVTFEVKKGQVVAVIGPSGAGKTTLLQALANGRAADQGEIRIDGARYSDWDTERLGRFIGYMPQDSVLFPGSVKDNISRFDRYAGVDLTTIDERAIAAAKEAGVHEMILGLPQGYDTLLGPRGRGLSAGQQQRVALARALYGQPVLYLLDEPNSNADAAGEAALLQTISRLRAAGAIVILSAHRLSLIAAVDQILVLNEGRMERFGPRDEVVAALRQGDAPPAAPATVVANNRVQ